MSKYYSITLKNARTYEAQDVRVNGLPLTGLHMLVGSGRLQFLAFPATQSGGPAGFKSLSGLDTEFQVVDPAMPGRRRRLRGRVTSATPSPGNAAPAHRGTETLVIAYEELKT